MRIYDHSDCQRLTDWFLGTQELITRHNWQAVFARMCIVFWLATTPRDAGQCNSVQIGNTLSDTGKLEPITACVKSTK
jgi:hypothetical protein